MISYTLYQKNPASHYIYIDLDIDDISQDNLLLQLPAWRPGRYELGNFAKNIKRVDVFDASGHPLGYSKLSKDSWLIDTSGHKKVRVTYSYYAAELNAGSCFADQEQLYVNPVHCCMFVDGRTMEAHRITLRVPPDYKIASSLAFTNFTAESRSFDELADSPFIASASLRSHSFDVDGIEFHLHFQGICKPDFNKLVHDFTLFTRTQIKFWGDFPRKDYHYLFQITPHKFYHGVEHAASTVIALGPGYALNSGSTYEDLLGVSSHELFHTWNVKAIRPAEMLPYDFSRENYARTGYVYEGFTTYYGDKLLFTSGAFTLEQYFTTLEERIQKHLHNYGRFNLSVAHSSWETWLDGYVPGAPYRKTSIYDEGCLVAFMLDVMIMKTTGNRRSLQDVCQLLYRRYGKTGKGYSEQDVMELVNEVAGSSFSDFFSRYVYSTEDFVPALAECFDHLGWKLVMKPAPAVSERLYGFKATEGSPARITLVAPYSPAWKAGLFGGDDVVAVNNVAVRGNLGHWLSHFADDPVNLTVITGEQLKTIPLGRSKSTQTWFEMPQLSVISGASSNQVAAMTSWSRI